MKNIDALKIDSKYIYYKCDNCMKINKRIKEIDQNRKNEYANYHISNSYNDFTNRKIKIKSNCLIEPRQNSFYKLIISDKTLKIK